MHVTAIIAAGGRGQRFGAAEPKQLLTVGGRPILERSVSAFLSHASVNDVVVVLPRELVDNPPAYLRSAEAVALHGSAKPLRLVAGGARRDRKSTRLNSSHDQISYAVFCLKKKKNSANTPLCPTRS